MIEEGKSEAQDQIIFLNWVHRHYPAQWEWLHHSPNGQARSKPIAAKLKLMAVKAGFPDLLCLWPIGQYHGCVIEMKLGKGRGGKIATAQCPQDRPGRHIFVRAF